MTREEILNAITAGAAALAVTLKSAHKLGYDDAALEVIESILGKSVAEELAQTQAQLTTLVDGMHERAPFAGWDDFATDESTVVGDALLTIDRQRSVTRGAIADMEEWRRYARSLESKSDHSEALQRLREENAALKQKPERHILDDLRELGALNVNWRYEDGTWWLWIHLSAAAQERLHLDNRALEFLVEEGETPDDLLEQARSILNRTVEIPFTWRMQWALREQLQEVLRILGAERGETLEDAARRVMQRVVELEATPDIVTVTAGLEPSRDALDELLAYVEAHEEEDAPVDPDVTLIRYDDHTWTISKAPQVIVDVDMRPLDVPVDLDTKVRETAGALGILETELPRWLLANGEEG